MLKDLLAAAGPGALIPAAMAALMMYLVNWFLGLEHRRAERRRQFLELWPKRVADDDLWTDVALRHLTGEYLPRAIVDVAMAQPDKAKTLIELAKVWDYLELTQTTPPQLRWKRVRYRNPGGRSLARWTFNLSYFALAWIAGWLLLGAVRSPGHPMAWLWGILGGLSGIVAFMMLVHDHSLKDASDDAPQWIVRMNALLNSQPAAPTPVSPALPGALP